MREPPAPGLRRPDPHEPSIRLSSRPSSRHDRGAGSDQRHDPAARRLDHPRRHRRPTRSTGATATISYSSLTAAGYNVDFVGSTTFPTYTGSTSTRIMTATADTRPGRFLFDVDPDRAPQDLDGRIRPARRRSAHDRHERRHHSGQPHEPDREPPRDHRHAPGTRRPGGHDPARPDHPDLEPVPERRADRPVQQRPPGDRGQLLDAGVAGRARGSVQRVRRRRRHPGRRHPPQRGRHEEDRGDVVRGADAAPSSPAATGTVPPVVLPTPVPLVVPGGTGPSVDPDRDGRSRGRERQRPQGLRATSCSSSTR